MERIQVINIQLPAGVGAGQLREIPLLVDTDYKRITGMAFHQLADGGVANNYNVGFRTDRKQWVDPININNWNANTGVAIEDKFREVDIPVHVNDIGYAMIVPGALTTGDLIGQLVLMLE
ncbi:MAG: hypothetical protein KF846_04750 [Cyclobacteriaceae bacterium]|nr:hypothetical protein [Cyclobacteriaceae bacterium]